MSPGDQIVWSKNHSIGGKTKEELEYPEVYRIYWRESV